MGIDRKCRLLIVEDERDLVEILMEDLKSLNCEIICSEHGRAALELIKSTVSSEPFDAILSDINMPYLNGLQLLEEIRKLGHEMPVIFLTAYGDKSKVLKALKLGAFDFIEKPYAVDELLQTIRDAFDYAQANEKLNSTLNDLAEASGNIDLEKRLKTDQNQIQRLKHRKFRE